MVEVVDVVGDQFVLFDGSQFGLVKWFGFEQLCFEGCGGFIFVFVFVVDVCIVLQVVEVEVYQWVLFGIVNVDVVLDEVFGFGI